MSGIYVPSLLRPILALNGWTLIMEIWMYATRIPAISRMRTPIDNTTTREEMDRNIPAPVRWKADNFSNLLEQPTQFYAVTLALAIAHRGVDDPTDLKLAWLYVGLRVVHSLVHVTVNRILVRFAVFVASSAVLGVLTARGLMLVF
ncbi:membrane-associated, eicosanoid/glutathione metabolism protein [Aspergillus spinulosporus]